MGKEPLYHEIRQESPFVNSVMEDFNTLKIVDGELRKEVLDNEGNVSSLLVCPECYITHLPFIFLCLKNNLQLIIVIESIGFTKFSSFYLTYIV